MGSIPKEIDLKQPLIIEQFFYSSLEHPWHQTVKGIFKIPDSLAIRLKPIRFPPIELNHPRKKRNLKGKSGGSVLFKPFRIPPYFAHIAGIVTFRGFNSRISTDSEEWKSWDNGRLWEVLRLCNTDTPREGYTRFRLNAGPFVCLIYPK